MRSEAPYLIQHAYDVPGIVRPKPQRRIIPFRPLQQHPERRSKQPRRKPVSIGVAFVYKDGIVFCADTKVTSDIKSQESKIAFHVSKDSLCALTFVMAGTDLIFLKAAVAACWEMVKKMDFSTATPDAVKNTAEFALAEFYRDHIYTHPDRAVGALYFELLVGIWLRGETRLFSFQPSTSCSSNKRQILARSR